MLGDFENEEASFGTEDREEVKIDKLFGLNGSRAELVRAQKRFSLAK